MKNVFSSIIASALLFGGCNSVDNTVICVQLDPLEKVFTEETYFVDNPETAAVAKGETATFQFVVRSAYPIVGLKVDAGNLNNGERQISATLKAFVDYIRAGIHAGFWEAPPSKDARYPLSDYYPDCLREIETVDLLPLQNQPVWVSYAIPRDAADGDYKANIVFTGKANGKSFKITKEVSAKVYPVTLPEQTLLVTNWYSNNAFSMMNGGQPVEKFSERYWELLKSLVNVMRDHGQNSYILWYHPNDYRWNFGGLVKVENTDGQYSFDFTNFDKTVELLISEGDLKRIEGGHLAGRFPHDTNWTLDHGVYLPEVGIKPFDDAETQNFLSQFLTALNSHLEKKGWKDIYMQHVADEPNDKSADSYIRISNFVKKHLPDIPIIDALHSHKLANTVNIWVPLLDNYHKDYAFFQQRQAAGDEVWFYTCCAPQGNYANRFLELPLIQTRLLHWLNYRYGATGYLHWGFNWWQGNKTNDASGDGISWPGGDAWIVYPAEGKVYTSIRLIAMRDGIADYELLKLLEQKAPEKAREIVGEPIRNFDNYNSNVRAFRLTRLKLLEALSN